MSGSSDPFYIVSYYIKGVTTSWTHSMKFQISEEKDCLPVWKHYCFSAKLILLFFCCRIWILIFWTDPDTQWLIPKRIQIHFFRRILIWWFKVQISRLIQSTIFQRFWISLFIRALWCSGCPGPVWPAAWVRPPHQNWRRIVVHHHRHQRIQNWQVYISCMSYVKLVTAWGRDH